MIRLPKKDILHREFSKLDKFSHMYLYNAGFTDFHEKIPSKALIRDIILAGNFPIHSLQRRLWNGGVRVVLDRPTISVYRVIKNIARWCKAPLKYLPKPEKKKRKIVRTIRCQYCHGTGKRHVRRYVK